MLSLSATPLEADSGFRSTTFACLDVSRPAELNPVRPLEHSLWIRRKGVDSPTREETHAPIYSALKEIKMMRRLDEARDAVTAVQDRDEKAFLDMALKTAWIDLHAGRDHEFDYLTFIEIMRAMYKKKVLLKDVLDGRADQHRWWPEDE